MKCKCGREVLYTVNGACDHCEPLPDRKPRTRRKGKLTPDERKRLDKERKRDYYLRNRERIIAISSKWNRDNPEKKKEYDRRYKNRIRVESNNHKTEAQEA